MNEAVGQDEWDVFLVHSDCANDRMKAEYIYTFLKRNNLSCITSSVGEIGKPLLEGSLYMIEHSVTTLVLLTLESRDKPWLKLDVVLALEKAVQSKRACVRLLVEGDRQKEFKKLGLLGNVPYLSLDFNRTDWENQLLHEVQKDPEILDNPLPAGNLALGQVYSVIVGYYGRVLPSLSKILIENQIVKQNLSTTSTRFFVLIPSDCKIWNPLTDCRDPRIKLVADKICANRDIYCGKERPCFVNLYSISDGHTVYYFVGEIPNVLNTISMLHANGSRIVKVDLSFEVDRFFWTLQSVLTHSKHQDCKDTFHVIKFKGGTFVDTVLTQIKKDISGTQGPNVNCDMTPQAELINSLEGQEYKLDAAVVFDDEVPADRNIALNISNKLSSRKLKVSFGDPGKQKFEFLGRARWKIIVLSKESRLRPMCIVALTDSIHKDKIGVIPVLHGLTVKEIPEFMTWISCISTNENYIDSILSVMMGQELQMDHCLPRGNVYTGLVWGYILNYLPIPLLRKAIGSDIQPIGPDLTSRIRTTLSNNNILCGCLRKLYICVPKSCEDRNLEGADGVAKIGELEAVKVEERPYQLAMYRINSPDLPSGQVCFLAEQPPPTRHLLDISKRYRDVGISTKDLHNQSEEFCKSCTANISNEFFIQDFGDLHSVCQFLFYDDETHNPAKALEILKNVLKDAIKADLAKNVEIVYP